MTMRDAAMEGLTVGLIAGVSAMVAITATHPSLPDLLDVWTSSLAGVLAGLVRFAAEMHYDGGK